MYQAVVASDPPLPVHDVDGSRIHCLITPIMAPFLL